MTTNGQTTKTTRKRPTQCKTSSSKSTKQSTKETEETVTKVSLTDIKPREEDFRKLDEENYQGIAESIKIYGFLQPLVIDSNNTLLAGAHRLKALEIVKKEHPETFKDKFPDDEIPVRRMPFDAKEDPDRAFFIEITENEKRTNFSAKEVYKIAKILKEKGYTSDPNRPPEGTKALSCPS